MEIPKSLQPGIKASPKPKPSAKPANAKPSVRPKPGATIDGPSAKLAEPGTAKVKSKPVAAGLKAQASAAAPQPSAATKSPSVQLDAIHKKVIQSIEAAAKAMSTARPKIERAKASREDRNNVVSKGGEVVGALLAPGRQVADLLGALGPLFPPCKQASSILAALIKFESERHERDVRVSVVYFDLARALAHVGALNRKSRPTKLIVDTLGESLKNFKALMEEFGQFCEAYYETKGPESRLKHLLHWKSNKDNLNRFTYRIEWLKRDLIGLLSQQAVPHPGQHADTLAQLESQLQQNRAFYYSIRDANEEFAEAFVSNYGGEATVQTNGNLLKQLAISVGESVTQSILNAIKETAKTTSKQSQSAFELKLKNTLDKWASGSQQKKVQTGPNHNAKVAQKKAQTGPNHNAKVAQNKVQTGPNHNAKVVQQTRNKGRGEIEPVEESTHYYSQDVRVYEYEYVVEESVTVEDNYQGPYHPLEYENANVELEGDDDGYEGPYLLEGEDSGGVPDTDDDDLQNDEEAIRELGEDDDNDDDDQTLHLEYVGDAGEYPGGDVIQNPYYAQEGGEEEYSYGDQEPEYYPQGDGEDSGANDDSPQNDDESGDEGDDW